jgi:ubiquinone/menaquinone biosynthesis C-methylase UbiE
MHILQRSTASMTHRDEVERIRAVYTRWEPDYDIHSLGFLTLLDERDVHLKRLLEGLPKPLAHCKVLDVGCGYGGLLDLLHSSGVPANSLFGIDLLPHRITAARQRYPAYNFQEANAERIDFPDQWFDIVIVFTVFSSILDRAMARNVASSIARVLTRDGVVIWYDMRYPNPWNPNVKPMTKSRIQELFPSFEQQLKSLTVLPPVARHLGPGTNLLYPLLAKVPVLRSHYLGVLRAPGR